MVDHKRISVPGDLQHPDGVKRCGRCLTTVDPAFFRIHAWCQLAEAATEHAGPKDLGEAMRAFFILAPGFTPMKDPVADRVFLDWFCGVFQLDPQRAGDAFYNHDTLSFMSGGFNLNPAPPRDRRSTDVKPPAFTRAIPVPAAVMVATHPSLWECLAHPVLSAGEKALRALGLQH